jgi:signal peptidase I
MDESSLESYHTESIPDPGAEMPPDVSAQSTPPEQQKTSLRRTVMDVIETLVLAGILFLVINTVSARIRVDGYSMEPTLKTGEFVFVNRLIYKLGSPSHGDVIVFRYPRDPEQEFIKRVIGLPGDRVQIERGQVMVNGQVLTEPYISAPPAYRLDEVRVPENQLFVLGDNRNNSSDSHQWGMVPMEDVIGKAVLVYWPPDRMGLIKSPDTTPAAP